MPRHLLLLVAAISFLTIQAQYNTKGKVHLAIGGAVGEHVSRNYAKYTLLGVTIWIPENSKVATTTLPVELGYALGNRFLLGLLIEPGKYIPDTADSNQDNNIAIVAVQPRYFLVNGGRAAWMLGLQLGGAALRIQDNTPNAKLDLRYSGFAIGAGTGVGIALGNTVGLELHLRFLTTSMELRAGELNDRSIMDVYGSTLNTAGFIGQLSLNFRLGG